MYVYTHVYIHTYTFTCVNIHTGVCIQLNDTGSYQVSFSIGLHKSWSDVRLGYYVCICKCS